MKTVGVLGGGQLGWMLSESVFKYGGTPLILSNKRSLASDRVPGTIVASWSDPGVLEDFFERCDVVTIEVEHVDVDALEPWADKMTPSLDVIRLAQHRMREKQFLAANDLPHAWFLEIHSQEEAHDVLESLEFPLIAKTAIGGYDGRGQFLLDDRGDYRDMLAELGDAVDEFGIVLEEPLQLEAEASVVLARDADGSFEFPVFENLHRDHILDVTHLPSSLPVDVERAMASLARRAAEEMGARGMLTTEFFVTRDEGRGTGYRVGEHTLYINEFAPRPHNSGHVSRNGCTMSQFDALARVLLGLPMEKPEPLDGHWCMANLLSDLWGGQPELDLPSALFEGVGVVDVVVYGKRPTRPKRKMGHIVSWGRARADALHSVRTFRTALEG